MSPTCPWRRRTGPTTLRRSTRNAHDPSSRLSAGRTPASFSAGRQAPTAQLLPGTLAHAVQSDLPGTSFFDVYYNLFGLAEPVGANDDAQTQATKTFAYFQAKLFFNATLCIKNRDRFVVFLKRQIGDTFELVGQGWDQTYGLKCEPQFGTYDAYLNHFRDVAINLNLVNGNSETGLNMRHFEITAAGGFLLCYQHPELANHFEIGKECAVFCNEQDLLEKIRYYLQHQDERIEIARAGQKRTLNENLYSHRLETLLAMAPVRQLTPSGAR